MAAFTDALISGLMRYRYTGRGHEPDADLSLRDGGWAGGPVRLVVAAGRHHLYDNSRLEHRYGDLGRVCIKEFRFERVSVRRGRDRVERLAADHAFGAGALGTGSLGRGGEVGETAESRYGRSLGAEHLANAVVAASADGGTQHCIPIGSFAAIAGVSASGDADAEQTTGAEMGACSDLLRGVGFGIWVQHDVDFDTQ